VYVHIEDAVTRWDADNSGFLLYLANCGGKHLFPGVDVTARLQPLPQSGVMDQQQSATTPVDHEPASRDMARMEVISRECHVTGIDELEDLPHCRKLRNGRAVLIEKKTKVL
jgi:hypothetical protein